MIQAAQACLNAILRYLGEKFGLYGASAAQKIRTKELLCEIYDVRNGMIDLVYPFKNVCHNKGEFDAKAPESLRGSVASKSLSSTLTSREQPL